MVKRYQFDSRLISNWQLTSINYNKTKYLAGWENDACLSFRNIDFLEPITNQSLKKFIWVILERVLEASWNIFFFKVTVTYYLQQNQISCWLREWRLFVIQKYWLFRAYYKSITEGIHFLQFYSGSWSRLNCFLLKSDSQFLFCLNCFLLKSDSQFLFIIKWPSLITFFASSITHCSCVGLDQL